MSKNKSRSNLLPSTSRRLATLFWITFWIYCLAIGIMVLAFIV